MLYLTKPFEIVSVNMSACEKVKASFGNTYMQVWASVVCRLPPLFRHIMWGGECEYTYSHTHTRTNANRHMPWNWSRRNNVFSLSYSNWQRFRIRLVGFWLIFVHEEWNGVFLVRNSTNLHWNFHKFAQNVFFLRSSSHILHIFS